MRKGEPLLGEFGRSSLCILSPGRLWGPLDAPSSGVQRRPLPSPQGSAEKEPVEKLFLLFSTEGKSVGRCLHLLFVAVFPSPLDLGFCS